MSSLDRIGEYVESVCRQLRWKKARLRVSEEMTNHVVDARDAYIAQGLDELSATERAIADTGDAADIGMQLDSIHRPKPQWSMLGATAVLILIGLFIRAFVFNGSDSSGPAYVRLLYAAIGIAGMFGAYYADFTLLGKYPKTIYFGLIGAYVFWIAILAVFPKSVGLLSLALRAGRLYFPHYVVLLSPIAFSAVIFAMRNKGYRGVIICSLAFLPLCYIGVSPFLTGFFYVTVIGLTLFGIAIYKNWFGTKRQKSFLIVIVPPVLIMTLLLAMPNSLLLRWLKAAIDPYIDPMGLGSWGVTVRELLSGAGFYGTGSMQGEYHVLLLEPLPQIYYKDLLLTLLIAQLGWGAFAAIISIMLFFAAKGLKYSLKQRSSLGLFASTGIIMVFCLQVFGYVVYNLGFTFGHPISLPLVSHGNAEMVINLVLIGFMLSVFRIGDVVSDGKVLQG